MHHAPGACRSHRSFRPGGSASSAHKSKRERQELEADACTSTKPVVQTPSYACTREIRVFTKVTFGTVPHQGGPASSGDKRGASRAAWVERRCTHLVHGREAKPERVKGGGARGEIDVGLLLKRRPEAGWICWFTTAAHRDFLAAIVKSTF